MSSQPVTYLTMDEYIELEDKNEFRSEFVNGEMLAMAIPTRNHARVASNTLGWVFAQLRGTACSVTGSHTRLFIAKYKAFTYPDIVVTCGPDRLFKDGRTIADATAIVEVLSPSTKDYDCSEKFRIYRALPSFTDYLVLSQNVMRAEHHTRMPDASWLMREFTAPADIIELKSIGCRLELQMLYERVEFDAEA